MLDGTRLQLNTGITPIANGSQLHIDHVSRGDEGQYICEGFNGLENISKSAFIAAFGKNSHRFYFATPILGKLSSGKQLRAVLTPANLYLYTYSKKEHFYS